MAADPHLEALALQLEQSEHYRVLRRVPDHVVDNDLPPAPDRRIGVVLDVETSGLDPAIDEVVELAMVAFEYDDLGPGRIVRTFCGLQEPTKPLSPGIERLTGLTAADLEGQRIADGDVEAFADGVVFVIAHNAGFDRPFAERRWPLFERRPWGCSLTQVAWRDDGFESSGLKSLLAQAGFFHHGHRALHDCLATLHLIGRPLPSGRTPFACILERSRAPCSAVWAIGASFQSKNLLKQRGYRWSDGSAGLPKVWSKEIAHPELETEIAFLERDVYRGRSEAIVVPVTPRDRFTARNGMPFGGTP